MSNGNFEQPISFQPPEIFAVKGNVFDDPATTSTKSTSPSQQYNRPSRGKPSTQTKTTPVAHISSVKLHSQPHLTQSPPSNSFRYPSVQNEEIFESKLQESPSSINSNKFKPENADTLYSYSTIKFSDDDETKFFTAKKPSKGKPPKRSTASFNLEQSYGGNGQVQHTTFDSAIKHTESDNIEEINGGFRPSTQFYVPATKSQKRKHPGKLFKSTEDEFKESEFFDFSIRPRPGQSSDIASTSKFSSDLSVKSLAIKPHKNKFDPEALQHGFKPVGSSSVNNFKIKDIPNIHGGDIGHGIASPGQIKKFYDAVESKRDERLVKRV